MKRDDAGVVGNKCTAAAQLLRGRNPIGQKDGLGVQMKGLKRKMAYSCYCEILELYGECSQGD